MELKKIVITGSTGFLGSNIIKELLLSNKYYIIGLVRDLNDIKKYEFLKELDGGKERLEIQESGELGSEYNLECFNKHFKEAFAVIHTASPFILYPDDIENDLFKPAVQGNLNVLKAALNNQDSIKKVIITSSTATIVNEVKLEKEFTNYDWFDGTGLPFEYIKSKYLSEKACLDFINSIDKTKVQYELIRINPGLITGPAVDNYPSVCGSFFLKNLQEIVNDETQDPMYYQRTIVMCDIRDTVKYFIGALESSESLHMERILIGNSNKSHSFKEVSDLVQKEFPFLNITQSIFNNNIVPSYYTLNYLNPKISLNEPLISFTDSIKDSLNYYIKKNNK